MKIEVSMSKEELDSILQDFLRSKYRLDKHQILLEWRGQSPDGIVATIADTPRATDYQPFSTQEE